MNPITIAIITLVAIIALIVIIVLVQTSQFGIEYEDVEPINCGSGWRISRSTDWAGGTVKAISDVDRRRSIRGL